MGSVGQTPRGLPQLPPAVATVWNCPASLQDQPLWASGLPLSVPAACGEGSFKVWAVMFTQAHTPNLDQDLCLVYLADVLPEQMGKGNDSLSHFCLHYTQAHPSFSHLLSLGQLPCNRKSPRGLMGEAGHLPPTPAFSSFLNTKVYIIGCANDETGSRLDKVKLHFYKVSVSV